MSQSRPSGEVSGKNSCSSVPGLAAAHIAAILAPIYHPSPDQSIRRAVAPCPRVPAQLARWSVSACIPPHIVPPPRISSDIWRADYPRAGGGKGEGGN